MLDEVNAAAQFIANLPSSNRISKSAREAFAQSLVRSMLRKFQSHWNVDSPMLGNGYRSIMTIGTFVDPVIVHAAHDAGIYQTDGLFPTDFTIWIDPHEVSYRIGEFGSICTLYGPNGHTHTQSMDSAVNVPVSVN